MRKHFIFLTGAALLLLMNSGLSIAQKSLDFSGKWEVEKVDLKFQRDDADVTLENCTWCGHYKSGVALEIDKDGLVKYVFEGEPRSARFTIQDTVLKVSFYDSPSVPNDGSIEIFTIYDFTPVLSGFKLRRSDPLISEEYHFIRE